NYCRELSLVKSKRTKQFHALFAELPESVQRQANEAYRLFRANPSHPSLSFKQVSPRGPGSVPMPSMIKCFLAYKQCLKWTHQLLEGSLFVEAVADTAPHFQPMAGLVGCLELNE